MSAPAAAGPQAKDTKTDGKNATQRNKQRSQKQRHPLTRQRPPAKRVREPGEILTSAGRPLDWGLRRDLEVQLGHNLSRVRVHTDRDAAGLAELIGADAVTVGQEIFFADGAYRPDTADGRRLLAHEILHTVQSPHPRGTFGGRGGLGGIDRVSLASEPLEQEAERAARSLAAGRAGEQARQIREAQTPVAGLLRYATVTADTQRSEQLDPATVVDRLVAGLLRSLRGDPDDVSGRVKLQLVKLAPELRENVLETMRQRVPSSDFNKVMTLVGKIDSKAADPPIDSHETPEPVQEPDPQGEHADREKEQRTQRDVAETDQQDKKAEHEKDKTAKEHDRQREDQHDKRHKDQDAQEKQSKDKKKDEDSTAEQDKKDKKDKDQKDGEEKDKEHQDKADKKKKKAKADADKKAGEQQEGEDKAEKAEPGKEKPAGAPGAEPEAGAIAPVGEGAAAGPLVSGGAPEAALGAVDEVALGPGSPLVQHGLLRRKGQQKHDTPPSGEEPLDLAADATAEIQAPADLTPDAKPPEPSKEDQAAEKPSDGLPTSDIELGNVPTADQIKLTSSGELPQPAVPTFPAPPKDETIDADVPPEQEARERTAQFHAEKEQEQREGPQRQPDAGQIGSDAIEHEPDTAPEAEVATPGPGRMRHGQAALRPETEAAPAADEQGLDEASASQPPGAETQAAPDGGELSTAADRGQPMAGPETDEASTVPDAGAPGADQRADMPGEPGVPGAETQQPGGAPPADGSLEAGGGGCGGTPDNAPDNDQNKACGGGGGGAGGTEAAPPQPAPPPVAAQQPRAALAAVSTLPPAQMKTTLGGVDQSVDTSVGKDRAQLKAAPPTMQRPSGAPQVQAGPPTAAPPVATQVPNMEAPPPQQKGEQKQPEEKQVAKGPTPGANVPAPSVAGDTQGKVTQEEADRIQGSIDNLPTTDPALHTTVGAAPKVELTGEKDPAQTDHQIDTLHDRSGQVAEVGKQDAALPLGEDHIYPNVHPETLKGDVPGAAGPQGGPGAAGPVGAAGPAGPGPAGPAAGMDDKAMAASVVAQQERGPQFKAAFAHGAESMGTEEQKKDADSAQAHQQNQAQIDAAVKDASTQQADERGRVKQQADEGRAQWRAEQDQKIADANKDADTQHGKARSDIDGKATDTDKQIGDRQKTDNKNIDDERAKAEDKAKKEKEKKQDGGGGFLGWVKSKITEAFNAVVGAITAVFDAARKLVQGIVSAFTTFATGLIDLATKAIIGWIKTFADILIKLGDVLLAAFPGLRDKWRNLIEGWRDKAIATVQAVADGLKAAVTKLLSALGSILSKILDGLEAGLKAAVKWVRDQVNALVDWAQQAIAILGEFASIIVDIAKNPGRWIANLGTAIKDGVRLYLFKAIVSAVKNWFNQKIEDIVGLGKLLFNVLIKGCMSMGQIVKMAWKALIGALPGIIIQLVIENVVAALIPAAAAVMKIVQGLIAAYNTISRIIAAIQTFIKFLKAVKFGTAACLFAETVASGAVALIDFIANWLLSKLKGAASGVASKLKGIAEKIMKGLGRGLKSARQGVGKAFNAAKKGASKAMAALKRGAKWVGGHALRGLRTAGRWAKKGWNALKRGVKALGHRLANTKFGKTLLNGAKKLKQNYQALKQKASDWWKKKHPKKDPKERLAAAVARIKPKVDWLLGKGVPDKALSALLFGMQKWYRLSSLKKEGESDYGLIATINPSEFVTKGKTVEVGDHKERTIEIEGTDPKLSIVLVSDKTGYFWDIKDTALGENIKNAIAKLELAVEIPESEIKIRRVLKELESRQAKGKPPFTGTEVPSAGSVLVRLEFEPGMVRSEYDKKAAQLVILGATGRLVKQKSQPREPRPSQTLVASRGPTKGEPQMVTAQRDYRTQVIIAARKRYGESTKEADRNFWKALSVVLEGFNFTEEGRTGQLYVGSPVQPDHIWDLQFSGADNLANLGFLGSFTNIRLGTRISEQLRGVKDGTVIRFVKLS